MEEGTRICSGCREEKPLGSFDRNRANRSGYHNRCKICRREERGSAAAKAYRVRYRQEHQAELREGLRAWHEAHPDWNRRQRLRRRFGLTPEEFEAILEAQDYGCACCREPLSIGGTNSFAIDHDHRCCPGTFTCGKCIRGILCGRCNKGLGLLGDSVDGLQRALDYLRWWECRQSQAP